VRTLLLDKVAPAPSDAADPSEEWVAEAWAYRSAIEGLIAAIEAEAMLNQHLDECEGRCMCGARGHQGDCHFGWHKDGCPDAPKVNMDDYMAGHRQGVSDERARIAEAVQGMWMRQTFLAPSEYEAAVLALIEEKP
jgi:hypothetical protein